MPSDLICPLMSYRVVNIIEGVATPIIVKCQEADCAIWDAEQKCCAVLALVMEKKEG